MLMPDTSIGTRVNVGYLGVGEVERALRGSVQVAAGLKIGRVSYEKSEV